MLQYPRVEFFIPLLLLVQVYLPHVVNGVRIEVFGKENFQDLIFEGEVVEGTCYNPASLEGGTKQSIRTDTCLIIYADSSCSNFYSRILPPGHTNLTRLDSDAHWSAVKTSQNFQSYKICDEEQRGSQINVDFYASGDISLFMNFPPPDGTKKLASVRDLRGCQNVNFLSSTESGLNIDNHNHPVTVYSGPDCTGKAKHIPGGHSWKSYFGKYFCYHGSFSGCRYEIKSIAPHQPITLANPTLSSTTSGTLPPCPPPPTCPTLPLLSSRTTCPPPPTCPTLPPPTTCPPPVHTPQISEEGKDFDSKTFTRPKVIYGMNQSIFLTLPMQIDKRQLLDVDCIFSNMLHTKQPVITQGILLEKIASGSHPLVNCHVPVLPFLGKIHIKLRIKYVNKPAVFLDGHVWAQKPLDEYSNPKQLHLSFQSQSSQIALSWNPSTFNSTSGCDISLIIIQMSDKFWMKVGHVHSNICNTGSHTISGSSISEALPETSLHELFTRPTVMALKRNSRHSENDTSVTSDQIMSSGLIQSMTLFHDVLNTTTENKDDDSVDLPNFDKLCEQWHDHENEEEYLINTKNLLPCPSSSALAKIDWRFIQISPRNLQQVSSIPITAALFVQSLPNTKSSKGVQCAYNQAGNLLLSSQAGTLIDRYNPAGWEHGGGGGKDHFTHDTLPYLYCCRWSQANQNNCRNYFDKERGIPFQQHKKYRAPTFAHVWGAGHFQTFDGFRYRFNGAGEFWMMKHEDQSSKWNSVSQFKCQVRLEPYSKQDATTTDGGKTQENLSAKVTVITAVAMQQETNGNNVTIQVSRNLSTNFIDVLVDGELVEASNELEILYHQGVNLFFNRSASEMLVVFQNGNSVKFNTCGVGEPGMNVIFSAAGETMANKTVGLLGNFDGDGSNDLSTPSSSSGSILQSNVTVEEIHKEFGLKWLVKEDDSIFTYFDHPLLDSSYQDFYKPDFVPDEPVLPELIFKFFNFLRYCGTSDECMQDALSTGSKTFARAAKTSQNYFEDMVTTTSKMDAIKECPHPNERFIKAAGVADIIVESLGVGSVINVPCIVSPTTVSNVTFTCVEQRDSTSKWISQNIKLSLKSCLYPVKN